MRLRPARRLNLIETTHSLLGPHCVAALACDAAALAPAAADGEQMRGRLEKFFQIAFNARSAATAGGASLVGRLLGAESAAGSEPQLVLDGGASVLSEPLSEAETTLLGALAPLAVHSPRAVKRYLNAYRIARSAEVSKPLLALMMAVGQSGDEAAEAAMDQLLARRDRALGDPEGPPWLVAALSATRRAAGDPLSIADAIAARTVARRYQLFG